VESTVQVHRAPGARPSGRRRRAPGAPRGAGARGARGARRIHVSNSGSPRWPAKMAVDAATHAATVRCDKTYYSRELIHLPRLRRAHRTVRSQRGEDVRAERCLNVGPLGVTRRPSGACSAST
jgi:hypothetical protein